MFNQIISFIIIFILVTWSLDYLLVYFCIWRFNKKPTENMYYKHYGLYRSTLHPFRPHFIAKSLVNTLLENKNKW